MAGRLLTAGTSPATLVDVGTCIADISSFEESCCLAENLSGHFRLRCGSLGIHDERSRRSQVGQMR